VQHLLDLQSSTFEGDEETFVLSKEAETFSSFCVTAPVLQVEGSLAKETQ